MKRPTKLRHRWSYLASFLLLSASFVATFGMAEELRGSMTVVGRGPERPVIEKLARAFEKTHIGTAIDIKWNRNLRTADVIKSGEADLAVAGREEAGLMATTVAWDGLALIVNFSNPVNNVTTEQAASLFSGTIREWSELHEKAEGRVRLIVRPDDQNLTDGFERSLNITGRAANAAEPVRSDQAVLSRVSGQLNAVGYLSLNPALEAVTYGISVRILLLDGIEPGKPTVKFGQYKLIRPVMFLTREQHKPLTRAFIEFALSPEGQGILDEMYVPLPVRP
jgi:phosphate transport system substrate-binding protein